MSGPTTATRLFALLGDPVAHSLSPVFQNAAFRAADVDGVYVALRCDDAMLPGLLCGIARAGGGGNITIPHKERAAAAVDVPTDAVRRTGACNTFWLEGDRVCGDNTDVAGFRAAASALVGNTAGARALVLGAGGAARAAVFALIEDGADSVLVLNRSPERAHALRETLGEPTRVRVALDVHAIAGTHFDLVVNATPLGLHPDDPEPLAFDRIAGAGAVLDLVYAPGETRWVRAARARGIPAADGLEMLLRQGAAAFERWWGRPAPLDAMRRAIAG
ncbi:MAG TPA: shikimate dehydrogenase [Longimicrobiales bacterium]